MTEAVAAASAVIRIVDLIIYCCEVLIWVFFFMSNYLCSFIQVSQDTFWTRDMLLAWERRGKCSCLLCLIMHADP